MESLVEKLKNKPESAKKKIALTMSLALTFVIIVIWAISARSISFFNDNSEKVNKLDQIDKTPISALIDTTTESIKSAINGIKDIFRP